MATYTDNGTNTPNGTHKIFTYTFPVLQTEDIKVALNGIVQATTKYTASLSPAQIEFNNTSIDSSVQNTSTGAPLTGVQVRVFRETTVGKNSGDEDPKAVFAAGSSIRAADLNANQEQALFAIHELQTQPIKTSDVENGAIISSKIKDLTIVDGDIASNAEIEVYKLKDGAANQVLVTQSDGTTTNWSSNLDLPGTLDVTGNVDFDANLNVDGATTLKGSLEVGGANAGTFDVATNGRITAPDGTLAKIQLGITGDNEIDTSSGNITIDSAGGTTTIDDNLVVTGTSNFSNATTTFNGSQVVTETASQTLTNKTLTTPVINDMSGTAVVTSGTSTSDNKVYSAKRAGEIFYGKDTVEEIQSGETWSAADNKVATTAAIDARIIDLVDDVGGFVPIANETSFPTANPDVNNGAGTLVSVKAIGSTRTPSGGTVTIANGSGSNTVTITGCGSTVLTAGFGVIVETTTTLHTYAFHRLVPKATEVTTVAGKATEVTTVHNNITNINAVANNATNINAVAADATDIGAVAGKATEIGRLGTADAVADMAILGTTDVVADLNTLGTADVVADMNMLATSDVVADMNTLATTSNVSNMNTVAGAITNVNNVGGSIASVNTAASNLNSINTFGDQYQVASNNPSTDGGGNALAAGDLYFNTSANELKVYNGSSWQGGVTAAGSFAATTGNTFTGDNRYNDGVKALFGTGSDLEIFHSGSTSFIKDVGTGNLEIWGDGNVHIKSGDGTETKATFDTNGSVDLYHDNSKKFETHPNGVLVTGNIYAADNKKIALGNHADLEIFHDGSHSIIQETGTGDLELCSNTRVMLQKDRTEALAKFIPDGAVELYYDNSKKFQTTSVGCGVTGNLTFADNGKAIFGAGDDLQIYHDGNSRIQNTNNSCDFRIQSDAIELKANSADEMMLKGVKDGAVQLYYDNVRTFHTKQNGVVVEGTEGQGAILELRADEGDDNADYFRFYADPNTSNLYVQNYVSGSWETNARFIGNGTTELWHDNVRKFETTSTGANLYGHLFPDTTDTHDLGSNSKKWSELHLKHYLYMPDDGRIRLGSNYDMQLWHDGSHQILLGKTGTTYITCPSGQSVRINKSSADNYNAESMIRAFADGAVELYHDNTKKFETTSTGVQAARYSFDSDNYITCNTSANTMEFVSNSTDIGEFSPSGLLLRDNMQLKVGTGNDLKLYHDGTKSYIDNNTGDLEIQFPTKVELQSNNGSEVSARFITNGSVELFYDNTKMAYTSASGFDVTNGDLRAHLDVKVLSDDRKLFCGANADLRVYHSGSHSYLQNVTDYPLWIQNIDGQDVNISDNNGGNLSAKFNIGGAAELYYDNSKKFETISSGVEVDGGSGASRVQFRTAGTNRGSVYANSNSVVGLLNPSDEWHVNFNRGGNSFIYSHFLPSSDSYNLGSSSYRWGNVYTNDLHLSNEGHTNDVDGTWGDYTIQEGESDLFLKNNRSGKKYKFNLTEVS